MTLFQEKQIIPSGILFSALMTSSLEVLINTKQKLTFTLMETVLGFLQLHLQQLVKST